MAMLLRWIEEARKKVLDAREKSHEEAKKVHEEEISKVSFRCKWILFAAKFNKLLLDRGIPTRKLPSFYEM